MAIEDLIPAVSFEPTRHPLSRVRSMLRTVGRQLEVRKSRGHTFLFIGGKTRDATQLLAEVGEALSEWERLDEILVGAQKQRQRIADRISAFVEFYTNIRWQIRHFEQKKRRPLTAAERVVAAEKLRETRRLRHTMGKRQKKKIKA